MGRQPYTKEFFEARRTGAQRSARALAPLVLQLVEPRSVIDVGCGVGTWLSVFRELGVPEILGVDGDYVDRAALEIPADFFRPGDLNLPIALERSFDLVVSLEVAGHLPPEAAEPFVGSLTRLGPVVLFSAAIPCQEGADHVNEQWPAYWAERFSRRDFVALDCLRGHVWEHEQVDWWYAQNLLLFVARSRLTETPALQRAWERSPGTPLALVHPRNYRRWTERGQFCTDHMKRLLRVTHALATVIPADATFILADQEQFRSLLPAAFHSIPFLERNGVYWGAPPDDETAIHELERLRQAGARFLVVAWPAFWFLDHYRALQRHLEGNFSCILRDELLVVFDLQAKRRTPGGRQPVTGPSKL